MNKIFYSMGWIAILLGVVLWPSVSDGQDSNGVEQLSLEACLQRALARSLPLANTVRDREIADATVGQVRAQVYPSLDFSASYTRLDEEPTFPGFEGPIGRTDNYEAAVTADQLLYSGGSVHAALKAAKRFRDVSEYQVQAARSRLLRDVTRLFYQTLLAGAQLEVRRDSVELLREFEEQTELKYELEAASEFDWLSARVKRANEVPLMIQASNRLDLAEAAMANFIYESVGSFRLTGELAAEIYPADLNALMQLGLNERPELQQLDARVDLAEADLRASQGDYFPELRLFGTYEGKNPGDTNPTADEWEWGWYAGVSASWSVLDGGLRRHTLREKKLEISQARAELAESRRQIRLEIRNAVLSLKNAAEVIESSRENVELAEKALTIARVRYDKGLITFLELNDSNLALNTARFGLNRARADYQLALADLRYACGIHDMNRKLP